jgi:hypothetical protein
MVMKVKCPSCQTVFTPAPGPPGSPVPCRCGKTFRMPAAAGAQAAALGTPNTTGVAAGNTNANALFRDASSSLFDDAVDQDVILEVVEPKPPKFAASTSAKAQPPRQGSPQPLPRVPAKESWRPQFENNVLFRTGLSLLLVGIASFILPAFGLQIRRLNRLGPNAPILGGVLGFVGAGLMFVSHAHQPLLGLAMSGSSAAVMGLVWLIVGLPKADGPLNGRLPPMLSQREAEEGRVEPGPPGLTIEEQRERDEAARRGREEIDRLEREAQKAREEADERMREAAERREREAAEWQQEIERSRREHEAEAQRHLEEVDRAQQKIRREMEQQRDEMMRGAIEARRNVMRGMERMNRNAEFGGAPSYNPPANRNLGARSRTRPKQALPLFEYADDSVTTVVVKAGGDVPFEDYAPEGAVLVGLHVSLGDGRRGGHVQAVRPIYQLGKIYREGAWCGTPTDDESRLIAKPGYVVGAVRVRAGLVIDAVGLTFVAVKDGQLQTDDTYDSPWLGGDGGAERPTPEPPAFIVGVVGGSRESLEGLGYFAASKVTTPEAASGEEASSEATPKPPAKLRTWTSADGKFKVEAAFVGVVGGNAVLRNEAGKVLRVPLAKLSEADQAFIRKK